MNENIIDKIRKILAKARDPRGNENESRLAFEIAQRLISQHNLDAAQFEAEAAETGHAPGIVEKSIYIGTRETVELKFVASFIIRALDIKIIRSRRNGGLHLEFIGTETDCDLAIYYYETISAGIKAHFKRYAFRNRGADRQSYYFGYVHGLEEASEAGKKQAETEATAEAIQSRALVIVAKKEAITKYIEDKHGILRTKRSQTIYVHGASYAAGEIKGRQSAPRKAIA